MMIISLMLIAFLTKSTDINNYPTFSQYVRMFNKEYSKEEYDQRKSIYEQRIAHFNKNTDYIESVNHFTDLTDQERKQRKGVKMKNVTSAEIEDSHRHAKRVGVPLALDWREKGVITKIKDQGPCGCCWAYASAAYSQSRLIIQEKKNKNIDLSQQYLLSCTKQSDCNGGYLEYTFDKIAKSGGIPNEDKFPYNPFGLINPFICLTKEKQYIGYIPETIYQASDFQLQSLLQDGPLAITISSNEWEDYSSGVFKCAKGSKIDHAVLLVGYTSEFWIIKNQWGEDWGEKGYMRITKSRYNDGNCRIGASAFYLSENNILGGLFVLIIYLII